MRDVLIPAYASSVPRLWRESIEAHRSAVRQTTLDVTAELVAEHGLRSVSMSQIAEATGIGRATLYKYFPDVEAILVAWHERQVADHLAYLDEISRRAGSPGERLAAVLEGYALMSYRHPGNELAALLHRGEHVAHAELRLRGFVRDLVAQGVESGEVRRDVAPDELAGYCLHALGAASGIRSKAAVQRLVALVLAGLQSRDK